VACPAFCSTTISKVPCWSGAGMRSASIRRCSASPRTIASNQDRWRPPAVTRRAAWSVPSAMWATPSLPPEPSRISMI
jgi:hypothetical protein